VGVIAFEMLTGRLPFEGPNALAIAHSHVNDAPPRASTRAPVPAPLDDLVLQLLAKNPSERPQSAAVVRERLKRMTPHLGLRVSPAPQLPVARDVRAAPDTQGGMAATVRVRASLDELPTLTMPTAELHARALKRSWGLPVAGAVALVLGAAGLYAATRTGTDGPKAAAPKVVPTAAVSPRTDATPVARPDKAAPAVEARAALSQPEAVREAKSTAPAPAPERAPPSRTAALARAVGVQPEGPERPVAKAAPLPKPPAPQPSPEARPAAPVAPAQAAAQPAPGKVRLLVKGWGNLTVDGTLMGQFPAPARFPLNAVELPSGTHLVELANGPAQKTWRSLVKVEPGATTELAVTW
jgi:serine/threonine-protein kinase